MAMMTKKERVRAALSGEEVDYAPFALWGHDFLREWSAHELAAATVEAYRADGYDFIKFNPRWTYFAEAWGNTYQRPSEQRFPTLTHAAISGADDLASVAVLDPRDGVFREHLEALRFVIDEVGAEVDVIQTVFSPLAVLALICGSDDLMKRIAGDDPTAIHRALDAVTETLAGYTRASIEEGAAGIFFAPLFWASYDHCDDVFYNAFGRPHDLRVLEAAAGAPFNILHVCRNNNMLLSLLDYPVSAFNWADRGDGNPSLRDARAHTAKALMGGIDHAHLHRMSVEEIREQAHDALGVGRGFFLTGGCGIAHGVSRDNRAAIAGAR